MGDGTQAAFVGADAYPYWANDRQARVQKNPTWQEIIALITCGKFYSNLTSCQAELITVSSVNVTGSNCQFS